jgi:hypothetical protein
VPRRSKLDPDTVATDQKLMVALDAAVRDVPGDSRRRRKITAAHESLQALVSEQAWRLYLDLEASVNERHDEQLTTNQVIAPSPGVAFERLVKGEEAPRFEGQKQFVARASSSRLIAHPTATFGTALK